MKDEKNNLQKDKKLFHLTIKLLTALLHKIKQERVKW